MSETESWVWQWYRDQSDAEMSPLAALNLNWTEEKSGLYLEQFSVLGQWFEREPERWSVVMASNNWRLHLVWVAALMVTQNRQHLELLKQRIALGSWVNTQLLVAVGLLHPHDGLLFLRQISNNTDDFGAQKREAATRILARLGEDVPAQLNYEALMSSVFDRTKPQQFSATEIQSMEQRQLACRVVAAHWSFWSKVVI